MHDGSKMQQDTSRNMLDLSFQASQVCLKLTDTDRFTYYSSNMYHAVERIALDPYHLFKYMSGISSDYVL